MSRDRNIARLFGILVALIWGLSFISIKTAVAEVPPMSLGFARFAVAVLVLGALALVSGEGLRIALRDVPLYALGGVFGFTLYFYGENNGVRLLSSSEASIIIGTIPIATMLAERIFIGTRLPGRAYVGALLSFAGVALIVAKAGGGTASVAGFLFMGLAALCWVAYSFVTRPVAARYGRVTVNFWQSLFGLVGFIPFALAESPAWRMPTGLAWLNILYLGLFCSALGYWLYISALDVLGAGASSVFINLIPVVAVIAGFVVMGDRLAALQWLGAAVAMAGVWLATAPGRKPRKI
jgi:drug/metabolite transporter (DMT)-like permease